MKKYILYVLISIAIPLVPTVALSSYHVKGNNMMASSGEPFYTSISRDNFDIHDSTVCGGGNQFWFTPVPLPTPLVDVLIHQTPIPYTDGMSSKGYSFNADGSVYESSGSYTTGVDVGTISIPYEGTFFLKSRTDNSSKCLLGVWVGWDYGVE